MNINAFLQNLLAVNPNTITWLVLVSCVALAAMCRVPKLRRLREIAPTLMLSIGIIGTFWGTFVALGDFRTEGLDGRLDYKKMVDSIPAVLQGMKTAFITTLIGMGSAFATRIGLRLAPEQAPKPLPQEQDALNLLRDIKQAISTDSDKSLAAEIAALNQRMEGLAKSIETSLVENITKLIAELKQAIIDQLAPQLEKTNDMLREQLAEMITKIEEALIKQFGKTFIEFNAATQAIKKWQEDHRGQVEQLTAAFNTTAEGIERIRSDCESIPITMDELQTLLGELDARVKAFADMKAQAEAAFPLIKQQLDAIGTDLQQSAAGFAGLNQTITDTYAEASKLATDHHHQLSGQVKYITEQAKASADEMLASMKSATGEVIAENRNAATQQRESLKQISTAVQKTTADCVATTTASLTEIAEKNAQQVSDTMAEIVKAWGARQIGLAERLAEIAAGRDNR